MISGVERLSSRMMSAPADAWADDKVRGYLLEAVGLALDHYGGTWFSRIAC